MGVQRAGRGTDLGTQGGTNGRGRVGLAGLQSQLHDGNNCAEGGGCVVRHLLEAPVRAMDADHEAGRRHPGAR